MDLLAQVDHIVGDLPNRRLPIDREESVAAWIKVDCPVRMAFTKPA
ncbi:MULTISPECIES: hypothetical protein [unclassified Methylobacterium]|nr:MULTISPECIES: hypothetical protein [unclassified Methylobacterium]